MAHIKNQFSSLSHVRLFTTPWTAACQASLSITNSRSPPKPMSIQSVMPSNHLILCHPLLLLPSIFPSIRVFSNESALYIMWPKYWSFSFSISPSNEYPGLISFNMDWVDLLAVQGALKSLLQHHSNIPSRLSQVVAGRIDHCPHDYWDRTTRNVGLVSPELCPTHFFSLLILIFNPFDVINYNHNSFSLFPKS